MGIAELDRSAFDTDFAAIRLIQTRDDLYQGALAGPVGTEQGVNLPTLHVKIDRVERDHARERLAQIAQFQDRRLGASKVGESAPVIVMTRAPRTV